MQAQVLDQQLVQIQQRQLNWTGRTTKSSWTNIEHITITWIRIWKRHFGIITEIKE
ncbi:hypothetical protein P3X46_009705 [Hevea brasiliensis]|uniref:Uncharacterized protein n=1 Tax=Hevea brasiliensis TaxID=3981 RepID=A0ABQ9MMR9_HEVBR|nr:hypothetical protein P3X46_009705 [Hevea brasiliensis]